MHGGVHGPYTVVVMYCVRVRAMSADGCVNEVRPRPKLKPRPWETDAKAEAKVIVTRPRLAVFVYNSGSTDLLGQRDLLRSFETANYLIKEFPKQEMDKRDVEDFLKLCEQRGPLNEHQVMDVRARGVVCRPVSTLKADILNITYNCCSQNNSVKKKTLLI